MTQAQTPADYVIEQFGGVRATARALGMSPSAVSHWRKRNGQVPPTAWKLVIATAAAQHIKLDPVKVMGPMEVKAVRAAGSRRV